MSFSDYEGLIKSLADRYSRAVGDLSLFDDLTQEAYICYLKCLESYDGDKSSFATFFCVSLKRWFVRYLTYRENRFPVAGATAMHSWKVGKYVREYVSDHGREPTDDEISRALNIPVDKVRKYRAVTPIGSLDAPLESGNLLSDVVEDHRDDIGSVVDRIYREQVRDAVRGALDCLTDTEKTVIQQRYFKGRSFDEIGSDLGISKGMTRYHCAQGIRRIRRTQLKRLRTELDISGTAAPTVYYRGGWGFYRSHGSVVEYCVLPENKKP